MWMSSLLKRLWPQLESVVDPLYVIRLVGDLFVE